MYGWAGARSPAPRHAGPAAGSTARAAGRPPCARLRLGHNLLNVLALLLELLKLLLQGRALLLQGLQLGLHLLHRLAARGALCGKLRHLLLVRLLGPGVGGRRLCLPHSLAERCGGRWGGRGAGAHSNKRRGCHRAPAAGAHGGGASPLAVLTPYLVLHLVLPLRARGLDLRLRLEHRCHLRLVFALGIVVLQGLDHLQVLFKHVLRQGRHGWAAGAAGPQGASRAGGLPARPVQAPGPGNQQGGRSLSSSAAGGRGAAGKGGAQPGAARGRFWTAPPGRRELQAGGPHRQPSPPALIAAHCTALPCRCPAGDGTHPAGPGGGRVRTRGAVPTWRPGAPAPRVRARGSLPTMQRSPAA